LKTSDAILISIGMNIFFTADHQMTSFLPHPLFVSALPGERKRTKYCIFNYFGIIA